MAAPGVLAPAVATSSRGGGETIGKVRARSINLQPGPIFPWQGPQPVQQGTGLQKKPR